MLQYALLGKLAAAVAAIGTAALASSASAGLNPGGGALVQRGAQCSSAGLTQVCTGLFDGGQALYPGSPSESASLTLDYQGTKPAAQAGLFLEHFVSHSSGSDAACTAADPASMLRVTVLRDGSVAFQGSLSALATHADSAGMTSIGRLAAGGTAHLTVTVSMDRAADNSYMGCVSKADFVWFAAE
ncbi:MAG TPA: hypothetical protein VIO62_16730 [Candidatus Dormibacteraeota bacterium]